MFAVSPYWNRQSHHSPIQTGLYDSDLEAFWLCLMATDSNALRQASQSGQLIRWIPEWQRLMPPFNIQHRAHHYPLDDHTLKVVEATKETEIYSALTPYEQRLVALSALLHDIDKNTGPLALRPTIPADKIHPLKSAIRAVGIAERLGLDRQACEQIFVLVHHHQAFGHLFVKYPEPQVAPDWELRRLACRLRSRTLVRCLYALSVGDIRSVQQPPGFYTPHVEQKLADYAGQVMYYLQTLENNRVVLNQLLYEQPHTASTQPGTASFFLMGQTEAALETILEKWPWAGCYWVGYTPHFERLLNQTSHWVVGVGANAENIAAYVPSQPNFPLEVSESCWQESSMALFYRLLLPDDEHNCFNLAPEYHSALAWVECHRLRGLQHIPVSTPTQGTQALGYGLLTRPFIWTVHTGHTDGGGGLPRIPQ